MGGGHLAQSVAGGHLAQSVAGGHSAQSVAGGHLAQSVAGGHSAQSVAGGHLAQSVAGGHSAQSVAGGHLAQSVAGGHLAQPVAPSGGIANGAESTAGTGNVLAASSYWERRMGAPLFPPAERAYAGLLAQSVAGGYSAQSVARSGGKSLNKCKNSVGTDNKRRRMGAPLIPPAEREHAGLDGIGSAPAPAPAPALTTSSSSSSSASDELTGREVVADVKKRRKTSQVARSVSQKTFANVRVLWGPRSEAMIHLDESGLGVVFKVEFSAPADASADSLSLSLSLGLRLFMGRKVGGCKYCCCLACSLPSACCVLLMLHVPFLCSCRVVASICRRYLWENYCPR